MVAWGCKSTSNDIPANYQKLPAKESTSTHRSTKLLKHDRDKVDSTLIISALKELSSNEYEGRKTGQIGNHKAQAYLVDQFKAIGLLPLGKSYDQEFECTIDKKSASGKNLIGYIKGRKYPDSFIGISAHYDHEGIKKGKIYNGADDNASGIGGLLGIAKYFSTHPPQHSIVFMAFDAEESGLQGSYYFASHPTLNLKKLRALINMDMISRSPNHEIFASGTHHFPSLKPALDKVGQQNPHVIMQFGHDQRMKKRTDPHDWTNSSDHAPFFKKGIPYIYFGVEDHPDYHKPTDDFEKVELEFYLDVIDLIIDFSINLDQNFPKIPKK